MDPMQIELEKLMMKQKNLQAFQLRNLFNQRGAIMQDFCTSLSQQTKMINAQPGQFYGYNSFAPMNAGPQLMANTLFDQNSYTLMNEMIDKKYEIEAMAARSAQAGRSQMAASNQPQLPPNRSLICEFCKNRISLVDYHCLICQNYDLCQNCFQNKQRNNSHRLYHPMIKQKSNDGTFEDKSQITLEKSAKMASNLVYDEHEKCCFCFKRLKGLTLKLDETNRFCLECYEKNKVDSFGPIYMEEFVTCDICNKNMLLKTRHFFLCQQCRTQTEEGLAMFLLCPTCCLNGTETAQHKTAHWIKFLKLPDFN